jgi:putative acetyltransferase
MSVSIRRESPNQPDILNLLAQSDALMASLYPGESNHMLDAAALEAPDVAFFVARRDDLAVGCGAWVRRSPAAAELKRVFVDPSARGLRIGREMLAAIEADAASSGIRTLYLETGTAQPEAIGLYRSTGYIERGPFGAYAEDPLSLFMEKGIGEG